MTRPAIRDRLVNWALYVRVSEKQGVSATAQVLDRLEEIAGKAPIRGYDESRPPRQIDEVDGQRVEEAWRKCMPATKDFLRMLYVWNAEIGWICRRLHIPAGRRDRGAFELRQYHAETEIERVLEDQPLIAVRVRDLHRVPPQ